MTFSAGSNYTNVIPTLSNGNVQNNGRFVITYPWFPLKGEQRTGNFDDDDDFTDFYFPCEELAIQIRRTGNAAFNLVIDMDVKVYYTTKLGKFEGIYTIHKEFPFNATTTNTGSKTVNGGNLSQILAQANSPLLAPSAALSTPQNIKVTDDLIIDQDYTFAGSANPTMTSFIQMEPDKAIIVKSGKRLTMKANIFGCASMWRAIEVENGATLIIDNSTIKDAAAAVYTPISTIPNVVSTLRILNSKFIDNYVALSLQDKRAVMTVRNNTFKQVKDLMHGQFINTKTALCAIELGNDISFAEKQNIFEFLPVGILSNSTTYTEIYSENSTYRYLGIHPLYAQGNPNACGIYAIGAQQGLIQVKNSGFYYFDFNGQGILANSLSVDVDGGVFNGMSLGVRGYSIPSIAVKNTEFGYCRNNAIWVQVSILESSQINNNDFSDCNTAIAFDEIQFNGNASFDYNTFSGQRYNNIRFIETHGNSSISNNVIQNVDYGEHGFFLYNSDDVMISNNNISYEFKKDRDCTDISYESGITIIGGTNNRVLCNQVKIAPPEDFSAWNVDCNFIDEFGMFQTVRPNKAPGPGLFIENANLTTIAGNKFTTLEKGVHVSGQNTFMSNRFSQNSMHSYKTQISAPLGLLLHQNVSLVSPILGVQEHRENVFLIDNHFFFTEARNYFGDPILSKFTVDPNTDPLFIPIKFEPQPWFEKQPSNGSSLSSPCATPFRVAQTITDRIILSKNMEHPLWSKELTYTARKRMYNAYKDYYEQIEPDSYLTTFISENQNGSMAKFNSIKGLKKHIGNYKLQNQTTWEQKNKDLATLQEDLQTLNEKIALNKDNTPALVQQYATKDAEKKQVIAEITKIKGEVKAENIRIINKALLLNSQVNINDNFKPEFNQKEINQVYFSTIATGKSNFNKEQWNIINRIANQCPYAGGDAVYEARNMYRLRFSEAKFNDSIFCAIPLPPSGKQIAKATIAEFKIYPNPADDYVTISCNLTDAKYIQIYDINGRVVNLSAYQLENNFISTSELENGMYFISLLDDNKKQLHIRKLLILK